MKWITREKVKVDRVAWLWHLSPAHNFLGAAICGALGTAWFSWFVFRTRR